MLYYLLLLLAGAVQGVMVSLNGQLGNYYSMFAICFFVHGIALILLLYIGGKMLYEGLHHEQQEEETAHALTMKMLIVQGIATSIDALSVGFTNAEYDIIHAFVTCVIIGAVTLAICLAGIQLGKKFGTKLAGKAGILGGIILILIGVEIFVSGVFM